LSLPNLIDTGFGFHPTTGPLGTGNFSQRVKCLGRESDHLPPPNTKVGIEGDILLLPRTTSWSVANLLLIIAVSQGIFLIYVSVLAPSVAAEFFSVVVSLAVTAQRRSQYPLSPLTHAPLIGQCEDIRIHLPTRRVTRTHL